LDKIISDGALILAESDIDIIRKKHEMKGLSMDTNTDLRWRLLAGRKASEDGDLLLSAAVPIIHVSNSCFSHMCRHEVPCLQSEHLLASL
jgi:hypothetical protein